MLRSANATTGVAKEKVISLSDTYHQALSGELKKPYHTLNPCPILPRYHYPISQMRKLRPNIGQRKSKAVDAPFLILSTPSLGEP